VWRQKAGCLGGVPPGLHSLGMPYIRSTEVFHPAFFSISIAPAPQLQYVSAESLQFIVMKDCMPTLIRLMRVGGGSLSSMRLPSPGSLDDISISGEKSKVPAQTAKELFETVFGKQCGCSAPI